MTVAKAAAIAKNASRFQMVPISELHVDPEAQRKVSQAWVKAHVPVFDVDQLGYIVVNRRSDGRLYVVDGQHRVELMRAVGWGDQTIHAEMFDGLTQAEEAELFNARNERRSVRVYDKFRISVTAGDEEAVDITRIVNAHGLVISDQLQDGHVMAVDALRRLYRGAGIASAKEGPVALSKALGVIIQAWGKSGSSVNGQVILSVGMLFLRYGREIDPKDLAKKLGPFPGGAPGVLGRARAMKEIRGRPIPHCVASIAVDVYNRGRRQGKVQTWES